MGLDIYIAARTSENDPTFQKMKKVADACTKAEVSYPSEVYEYFDRRGASPENPLEALETHIPFKGLDGPQVQEILLSDLPKGTEKLIITFST